MFLQTQLNFRDDRKIRRWNRMNGATQTDTFWDKHILGDAFGRCSSTNVILKYIPEGKMTLMKGSGDSSGDDDEHLECNDKADRKFVHMGIDLERNATDTGAELAILPKSDDKIELNYKLRNLFVSPTRPRRYHKRRIIFLPKLIF